MNIKRIIFWASFIIILILIVWGLIVASNKTSNRSGLSLGQPAKVTDLDHVTGPKDAPVTLVEYSDFQCPACESYFYVVERLMASSTVPIRFVYRHFPLSQHANAVPASLASEAAGVQGKFWEMYRLLFDNHTDWTELKDPNPVFIGYATKIGLNIEAFKSDMASSTLKQKITDSVKEGTSIGISGTPTFFVNGKVIDNPKSYEEFKTIIEQASKTN
jgi:protein-disulfide isomerase